MNFRPQTEKELAEAKLFPAGPYEFEILNGSDKPSKRSGKPMIELKVKVVDRAGTSRVISDYLLAETPLKLRHAAETCGLLAKYNTGALSGGDFCGKRGKLKLAIEKDRNRKYPDKNVVADYLGSEQRSGLLNI